MNKFLGRQSYIHMRNPSLSALSFGSVPCCALAIDIFEWCKFPISVSDICSQLHFSIRVLALLSFFPSSVGYDFLLSSICYHSSRWYVIPVNLRVRIVYTFVYIYKNLYHLDDVWNLWSKLIIQNFSCTIFIRSWLLGWKREIEICRWLASRRH